MYGDSGGGWGVGLCFAGFVGGVNYIDLFTCNYTLKKYFLGEYHLTKNHFSSRSFTLS